MRKVYKIIILLALIGFFLISSVVGAIVDHRLDLNKATYDELVEIPGIGDKIAREIISMRPIQSWDQLEKDSYLISKNRITLLRKWTVIYP